MSSRGCRCGGGWSCGGLLSCTPLEAADGPGVYFPRAGADRELAEQVLGWLPGDGHEVFLDGDLRAGLAVGEQWQPRLYERLRWADAVVCLVSQAYRDSTW